MRIEIKTAASICALIVSAGFVRAAEDIYWANGKDPLKDRNNTVIAATREWVVAVFKTGADNAIDNYNDIAAHAAGADDQLMAMYAYVGSDGANGYFAKVFSTATANPPSGLGLKAGDKIYSRIFDAANIASARWCAVLDDGLVTVPDYTYPPGNGWVYDPGNLAAADWIEILANVSPSITLNPQSLTNDTGSSATFSVSATGTPPLYYQWRKNSATIGPANSATYTINPVAAGDAGGYQCLVSNMFGVVTSAVAVLTVNAATPSPPTGVSASDGAYTDKVRVTWAAVASASGYEVWRNTSDSSTSAGRLGASNLSPYDDTTADAGRAYYYWLKATRSGGVSGFSASDPGYRATTDLAAPTNVMASDGSYTDRVALAWDSVTSAAGYEVWRNSADEPASATRLIDLIVQSASLDDSRVLGAMQLSAVTRRSYDDTTATAGATNFYWVRAKAGSAASAFSSPSARGSVAAAGALPAPESVTASTCHPDKICVVWPAVAGATGYEAWRGTLPLSPLAVKIGEGAGTGGDDLSVVKGTTYYYWIKARNATQTSAFSAMATGRAAASSTIEPVVGINGSDASNVTLRKGDALAVRIALFTSSAQTADWWLIVVTPFGWCTFDALSWQWVWVQFADLSTLRPAYQGALYSFMAPYEVVNMNTALLEEGAYTFYFGVDTLMNGVMDGPPYLVYDSVMLTIMDAGVTPLE